MLGEPGEVACDDLHGLLGPGFEAAYALAINRANFLYRFTVLSQKSSRGGQRHPVAVQVQTVRDDLKALRLGEKRFLRRQESGVDLFFEQDFVAAIVEALADHFQIAADLQAPPS